MIIALAMPPAPEVDFDAVNRAVSTCDRAVISKAVTDDVTRHSAFLIQAYKDQRMLAAALAERRRKLRGGGPSEDTEQGLSLAAQDVDDRQHALDDERLLDRLRTDMIGNFRQNYIAKCSGRPS